MATPLSDFRSQPVNKERYSEFSTKKIYHYLSITRNHRKTGVNSVALVNRFLKTLKCWIANFCIHDGKGPVSVMNQLKSIYNSPFIDLRSRPFTHVLRLLLQMTKHTSKRGDPP